MEFLSKIAELFGSAESDKRQTDLIGQIKAINKSQAVIEFKLDGTILTANDNFLATVGYSLEEIRGQHHSMFVPEADRESAEYKAFWDKLGRGEYDAGQYKRIGKGGRAIWIQATYNPVFDRQGKAYKVVKYASDITEQTRQIANFTGQIDAMSKSQAVIEFNLEGIILNANENFLATVGYSLDEIRGQHHRMFMPESERESAEYKAFWEKLGRGEYDAGQYKRIGKGGKEVWIQASYNPIFDPDGQPYKVVKYATDITSQKRQIANFTGQIDAIGKSQAVIEFNLDGTIISANENFLVTVGYGLDEIRGQHHRMFMPEAERESSEYRAFWKKLGGGEFDSGQYKRIGKGGREVWIQASYNPIFDPDGRPYKVVKYATDITVQKQKIADFTGQIDAIGKSQAVIEFDLDGTIRHANENFLATVGYSLEEIRGQHHRIFMPESERDTPEYKAFWAKLARGEYDAGQYKRIGNGGREVWIQASYNPIFDPENKPFKVVKYASDITAEVRAREVLEEAIARTQSTMDRVAGGELAGRIELDGLSGEMETLCQAINSFLESNEKAANELAAQREREAVVAAENLRIRIALDNTGTNVMIADNDRVVRYANKAVLDMLADAEADIRKELPQFNASTVINGSIDQFHKHPEHQKRMLEALKGRHQAQIKVGRRTFGLAVNPVLNEAGERLGTVVEWDDRTAELAVESEIANIVDSAANGDFSQRVEESGKTGFFLSLAEGINRLLETSETGLTDIARVLGELAKGNLTTRIDADYQGMYGQLKNDVNSTIDNLKDIVKAIKSSAEVITTASREIAAGNADLSSRTEEQAASLEETASSMEEFTSTVKQNAENARQANQLTLGASDVATQGGQVVGEVVTTMDDIATSSKKVEDIIGVIDGIAFQTNILALNAAVEAARAGEQGRGFAVVAGEVRSLAQRSSAAAKEIKTLINESVNRVENGTTLVQRAGETMQEIVTSVKRVADIMAEITAASEEQRSGIEQVNQTVSQMDQATQQNAALVEQASASAQSLDDQTGTLMQAIGAFSIDDDDQPQRSNGRAAVEHVHQAEMPRGVPLKPAAAGTSSGGASIRGRQVIVANGKSNGKGKSHGHGRGIKLPSIEVESGQDQGSDHWEEF